MGCGELTRRLAMHTEQSVNHISGMDHSLLNYSVAENRPGYNAL